MKKNTLLLLIIISLIAGYLIGQNTAIFSGKRSSAPYTYNIRLPDLSSGNGAAFSDIVKVISPLVVNISTSKTVTKKDSSPFFHFFDDQFRDFMDPFNTPKKWKEQSLGSGVLVSPDGYIITNSHVVEQADEIKVTLFDKQTYDGKIVGTDSKTDIAIIKISATNLPAINWGDSDSLQVGEFVLAFGNPYSLGHTVTMGIVSAVGRANVGIADFEDFIQTDAAINPGNSGGPLVNIKGELVGINTAIFSRTGGYQGIGFAVPSNMAKSVMTQLIKEGRVTRGWLGVTIQNVSTELAKEFGLKKPTGALVTDIFEGSPAEKAKLIRGDVILEINGKKIENVESLRNIVAYSKIGSSIKLKVLREGKTISLDIDITEFPQNLARAVPDEKEDVFSGSEKTLAGFGVMELSREIAKQLGLSRSETGVVIVSIEPGSDAEEAGLKKGDVIQEVNRKKVRNMKEFNSILSTISKKDTALFFINRGGNKFYITLKAFS